MHRRVEQDEGSLTQLLEAPAQSGGGDREGRRPVGHVARCRGGARKTGHRGPHHDNTEKYKSDSEPDRPAWDHAIG